MRIFFSHSSRDKALMRELRGYLPPWISSWIDEDELLFGADLNASLQRVIEEEVDYVVLFLGYEALDSEWVKREVDWALKREEQLQRVFLLPVLLVDVYDRLNEFGLENRLTLESADFSKSGVKFLADKIINHLGGWLSEMLRQTQGKVVRPKGEIPDETIISVTGAISAVPAEWRATADEVLVRPLLDDLMWAQVGRIPLTSTQYYQRILAEMSQAKSGARVMAVAMLASDLWTDDFDQAAYERRNLEAVQRNVKVRRLFLTSEDTKEQYRDIIATQLRSGVDVRVATNRLLGHVPQLEDFVLFGSAGPNRAYVALPVIDASRRVRSGFLELSPRATRRLEETFEQAWELGASPSTFYASPGQPLNDAAERLAPGTLMRALFLDHPVLSCDEAAAARGIPLTNELKTLILQTSGGLVAAHLPGDGTLSLRKVKERLNSSEAYLADPEQLLALGLSAGTVSAVLDPVWSMPHLVSRRLMELTEVATNNGSRTGYFVFSPQILTTAAHLTIGEFER